MFILFDRCLSDNIWFWQRHYFHGANAVKGNETHSFETDTLGVLNKIISESIVKGVLQDVVEGLSALMHNLQSSDELYDVTYKAIIT